MSSDEKLDCTLVTSCVVIPDEVEPVTNVVGSTVDVASEGVVEDKIVDTSSKAVDI